jgi:hypothetical protein
MCAAPCEKEDTWIDLLWLLFDERSFFGLKKEGKKGTSTFKVVTSKKVLDCFLEKSWGNAILGSRGSGIRDA